MDLTPYLPWMKYLHVIGAFLFVAGHGVSLSVAMRLRRETEPSRMLAMLDLSAWALNMAGIGLLVLLVAGIVDGVVGGYFGRAWIWISLVLLIVIGGLMTPLAGIHFGRLRSGLGQRWRLKPSDPDPTPLAPAEIAVLASSRSLDWAAVVGLGGFAVILWLMTFKPF
ncbi:MAG: hypothetical protein HY263_05150 [Chloroflexi bacterium]|nr:hypothetical protein [Chloroflexota bacterium]